MTSFQVDSLSLVITLSHTCLMQGKSVDYFPVDNQVDFPIPRPCAYRIHIAVLIRHFVRQLPENGVTPTHFPCHRLVCSLFMTHLQLSLR